MRRLLSILLGLVGVAFLWSIRELKEQARLGRDFYGIEF